MPLLKVSFFHTLPSAFFAVLLAIIYQFEISKTWAYWGFEAYKSIGSVALSLTLVVILSFFIPTKLDTRSFCLSMIHYLFFIPSLLNLASTGFEWNYFIAIFISISLILITSAVPLRSLVFKPLRSRSLAFINFTILIIVVTLIGAFGGLASFNLDLLSVYEFRREASANLPNIFGYVFSITSKVVAPITLIFAIRFRSWFLAVTSLFLILLLFGMTHHKSVIFLPIFVGMLYFILQSRRPLQLIISCFIVIAVISALEIFYLFIIDLNSLTIFTNLIVRRVFFVPPFIDSVYLDFFAESPKFFWSTSRFGAGLTNNPYDVSGAFLIGSEVFSRESTAANAGIIGSGFSHAGHTGIAIYAGFLGVIISFLQAYGKALGHKLTTAISISLVLTVVTSSDLTTVVLSHGLAFLFLLLLFFPRNKSFRKIMKVGAQ